MRGEGIGTQKILKARYLSGIFRIRALSLLGYKCRVLFFEGIRYLPKLRFVASVGRRIRRFVFLLSQLLTFPVFLLSTRTARRRGGSLIKARDYRALRNVRVEGDLVCTGWMDRR